MATPRIFIAELSDPEHSHYALGQDGWEEVADDALEWAVKHFLTGWCPPSD